MADLSLRDLVQLHGFKSVRALSRKAKVSEQTLRNWRAQKPDLFRILLLSNGAVNVAGPRASCDCGMCEG